MDIGASVDLPSQAPWAPFPSPKGRPVHRRMFVLLLAAALVASGCSLLDSADQPGTAGATGAAAGGADGDAGGGATPEPDPTRVPVQLPEVRAAAADGPLDFSRVAGDDRIATAVRVSADRWDSATVAVLARADDFADALAATPLAAQLSAPVLLTMPDELAAPVGQELDRLGAERVVVLGGPAAVATTVTDGLASDGYDVDRIRGEDRYATAAAIGARLPRTGRVYVATGTDYPDALAAGVAAARLPAPLLLVDDDLGTPAQELLTEQLPSEAVVVGGEAVVPPAVVDALDAEGLQVTRLAGQDRFATAAAVHEHVVGDFGGPAGIWLASAAGFADALAAGPAAARENATLLLAHPRDQASADATVEVLGQAGGPVTVVGGPAAVTDQLPRQVRAVLAGNELPGGGTVLFPEHRLVAYYGNAEYAVLGVLGETSPQEAADRISEIAEEYRDGEREVMPTFELIVTIATAAPGEDGNYSAVGDLEDVREYLEVARQNDIYLFLDFQPGRNRFIDQVRIYEEFIREPDVGIALDPEWRVTDTQRPGQLIGSVDAAEVNEVVDWAADIVREENLPQKLLVVHQFRTSMIRNREQIRTPPELAVTIHVDGFGTQPLKLETWGVLASDDAPWAHGFKLFYDEDTNIFSPEQVLDFSNPAVDLITYQ